MLAEFLLCFWDKIVQQAFVQRKADGASIIGHKIPKHIWLNYGVLGYHKISEISYLWAGLLEMMSNYLSSNIGIYITWWPELGVASGLVVFSNTPIK